jgi:hypothetical protein
MDEAAVREQATAFGDALVAGDVDMAVGRLSPELRRNLGEVLSLFPLPATDAGIDRVERTASGWKTVLRLVGETEEVEVEIRWKDRDGAPTIVEASHLSRVAVAEAGPIGTAAEAEPAAASESEGPEPAA